MTKKNKSSEFRGESVTELAKAPVEPAEVADADLSVEVKNPPLPVFKEIFKTVAKGLPSMTTDDTLEGTLEEEVVEGQQSWADLVEEEEQSPSRLTPQLRLSKPVHPQRVLKMMLHLPLCLEVV